MSRFGGKFGFWTEKSDFSTKKSIFDFCRALTGHLDLVKYLCIFSENPKNMGVFTKKSI